MKSFSLIVFLSLLILSFSLKDSKHLRKKHNDCNKQNEFQFYSNNITIKDNANIVSFPGYYNERILYNNYTNDNDLFSCKADSELDAKIKFRLCNDFSDTKRYEIISVKGVKN